MGEVWTPAQANRIFRCATLASFRSEGVNYCVSEGLAESRMRASSHVSTDGEAKCVRGPSVRGARRLTSGGVLRQYVEHGEQAQRSNGGPIACFGRQVVRNAG